MHTWRRNQLEVIRDARRRLADPLETPAGRELALCRLGIVRELFMRQWLARRLRRFLTRELAPFTAEAHASIFDGLHASREALELWRHRLASLNHEHPEVKRAETR